MAFFDTTWYLNFGNGSSTGYYAVPQFATPHTYAAGDLIRQLTTPAVGAERVFVCVVAGAAGSEPTWTNTRGAKNTSTTPVFIECTGAAAVNGDATNTKTWTGVTAGGVTAITQGAIIRRNSGTSYWVCTTAGNTSTTEPAWPNDTAGSIRTDGTVTWTCLGVVGNFTGGGAPHARLANATATTWCTDGNTIYVSSAHAETQASALTVAFGASAGLTNLVKVVCTSYANFPPLTGDVTTGATVTTTGNNVIALQPLGWYVNGVTFSSSSGAIATVFAVGNNSANATHFYENCSFQNPGTSGGSIRIGSSNSASSGYCEFNNCTVKFGAVGQLIAFFLTNFYWRNTGQILVSGSSVPTTLFSTAGTSGDVNNVLLEGLDLSQINTVLFTSNAAPQVGVFVVKDCKLNASMAKTISPFNRGWRVDYIRCDSAATGYITERHNWLADETTETSITRVGGAADPTGQAQSRKIVTTARPAWHAPYNMETLAVWNSTVSSNVTVTVEGTINAGSVPNNDDIWIEVEYLGSTATPLGSFCFGTKANLLATGSALTASGSTWNGGGSGGGWSPFKMAVTLGVTNSSPQPGLAGYIYVRVKAAKITTTFYVDPLIVLS